MSAFPHTTRQDPNLDRSSASSTPGSSAIRGISNFSAIPWTSADSTKWVASWWGQLVGSASPLQRTDTKNSRHAGLPRAASLLPAQRLLGPDLQGGTPPTSEPRTSARRRTGSRRKEGASPWWSFSGAKGSWQDLMLDWCG